MTMPEIHEIIEDASKLPLNDAAYYLWIKRREYDQLEKKDSLMKAQNSPYPNTGNSEMDKAVKVLRDVISNSKYERENAQSGVTFDRLKLAHPERKEIELKNAVSAAAKLDMDCSKYFEYTSSDYSEDIHRAITKARLENPGFQDSTYENARFRLATAMR